MGTYVLNLPSGLCLNLDYCYYVLALIKNNILVFCNNSCYIMLNGVLCAGGTLNNGIYNSDMSDPILNINDIKETDWKKY